MMTEEKDSAGAASAEEKKDSAPAPANADSKLEAKPEPEKVSVAPTTNDKENAAMTTSTKKGSKKPAAKKPAAKKPAAAKKQSMPRKDAVYSSTNRKCPYREGSMKAKSYALFAKGGTRRDIIAGMVKIGATEKTASSWLQGFRRFLETPAPAAK